MLVKRLKPVCSTTASTAAAVQGTSWGLFPGNSVFPLLSLQQDFNKVVRIFFFLKGLIFFF